MNESLTYEEALKKYFGDVLRPKTWPLPCTCGKFWLMHLDESWVEHLRTAHDERVVSPEQREKILKRRKEKEAEKKETRTDYSSILRSLK